MKKTLLSNLFKSAVLIEKDSLKLTTKMKSKYKKDINIQQILYCISEHEEKHIKDFSYLVSMTLNDRELKIQEINYEDLNNFMTTHTIYKDYHEVFEKKDAYKMLDYIMDNKKQVISFYKRMRQFANSEIKRVLDKIVEEERSHVVMILDLQIAHEEIV